MLGDIDFCQFIGAIFGRHLIEIFTMFKVVIANMQQPVID
ncbi:Uncharacterised protein [Vibrio cholerae]|nr:Uncharacterised protein [Vibrio cholerae]CSI71995.1 Uncharacterised protein [Vibrio cholerae]